LRVDGRREQKKRGGAGADSSTDKKGRGKVGILGRGGGRAARRERGLLRGWTMGQGERGPGVVVGVLVGGGN